MENHPTQMHGLPASHGGRGRGSGVPARLLRAMLTLSRHDLLLRSMKQVAK